MGIDLKRSQADGKDSNGYNRESELPTGHGTPIVSGILLFLDQLIVAAGGWAFWLVINAITTPSEIGSATVFYSLVMLITAITQLGLEYPLLRKSSSADKRILGTVLGIELIIAAASVPVLLYVGGGFFGGSPSEYVWLSIGILLFTSAGFVSRFALLGISDARSVILFDTLGTAAKFGMGYGLVSAGFGAAGILCAFLAYTAVVLAGTLFIARRKLTFAFGPWTLVRDLLKDGLANMPSKLARMFVMSLSVVLLAFVGVSSSEVGVFYIIVMVSLTAGSFASSLAYMIIPASSVARTDLSADSMRVGLSFTAPLIVALAAQPQYVLSLLGQSYVAASTAFSILVFGILPAAILTNTIAHLNNVNRSKDLVLVGSAQIIMFLVAFFILTPYYGLIGASIAITLGLSLSAILSLMWSTSRKQARSILVASGAILAGWSCAYAFGSLAPEAHPTAAIATGILASFAVIFGLRNVSFGELDSIVRGPRTVADDNRTAYFVLGNYGNYNMGDEVLLRAVVTDVVAANENAKFYVPTRNPKFVQTYHEASVDRIIPLPIGEPIRLMRSFLRSRTVIVGGGGIWSGYTGPLAHLIPIITIIGKLLRKKVEFRAIGLYSTASRLDKILVNLAIAFSDSCSVRDQESLQMLWQFNQRRTRKVPDLAIQYLRIIKQPELDEALALMHKNADLDSIRQEGRSMIGISVKPVTNDAINQSIIGEFAEAIDQLNSRYPEQLHFVFFPFAKTKSDIESDNTMVNAIVRKLGGNNTNVTVLEHLDPLSWFACMKGDIDLFIGMRLHSIIFASIAEMPILCIPYERKVEQFVQQNHDSDTQTMTMAQISASRIIAFVEGRISNIPPGAAA